VEALFAAEEAGINTYLALAEGFMLRVIRQYRNEGGTMNVMFQTYPAVPLDTNMWQMMELNPIAIYHQGTTADQYVEDKQEHELVRRLETIRTSGGPVGLATHDPSTLLRAESEGWGADFYMCCLHAMRKRHKPVSSFLVGPSGKGAEILDMEDRAVMLDVIERTPKPCIAFKVFAGGQVFRKKAEDEIPRLLDDIYREVFGGIKDDDIACIGVFQKHKNQLLQSAESVRRVLAEKAHS
jgi:hypothetical protein